MKAKKSHTGETWRDQWDRMLRWHQRLSSIRGALPSADTAKARALDDVFAFFMNCYHLRDWVQNDRRKTKAELKAFFSKTTALQLGQDIVNGLKHYRLKPARAASAANIDWTTATRTDPTPIVAVSTLKSRAFVAPRPSRWVFETKSGDKDMDWR